ncbi:MAG: hypothetical protein QOD42_2343 [Sphingomonadales bacterium]|jgi:hypothetical protein|nr:hypothetical protein [Sphingomonadales bacterium]
MNGLIEERRSRAVPIAMTVFGPLAVFMGLLNPGANDQPRPSGPTTEQIELVRADAAAGFPRPPLPDNTPRDPGA